MKTSISHYCADHTSYVTVTTLGIGI